MSEIIVLNSFPEDEDSKFEYSLQDNFRKIQDCLYSQWIDGTFCDLELQTINGCIRVHTCVMAAFSPKIATKLNEAIAIGEENSKVRGTICLDIMFSYCIIKSIVEAFYSGLFCGCLENLTELRAALEWLEIDELVYVVKSVQERVENVKPVVHDSMSPFEVEGEALELHTVTPRVKRHRRGRKYKAFVKLATGNQDGNNVNVAVSLVNEMPLVSSLSHRERDTLSDDFNLEMIQENKEDEEESMNHQLLVQNEANSHDGDIRHNNLNNRDQLPEPDENISEHTTVPAENDLAKSRNFELPLEKVDTTDRQNRKRTVKKRTKQEEIAQKCGQSPKLAKKSCPEIRGPGNTCLAETAVMKSPLPNPEKEEEMKKKQYASEIEALVQEVKESEQEGIVEQEQAFLRGDTKFLKCIRCRSCFINLDEYRNHIQNHPTYTCVNCYMVFLSSTLLCRHIRKAHLKSMHLKCSQCNFTAQTDLQFRQHCAEVHGELRPFKCLFEGCNYKTSKYRYLSGHFENHENIRDFVCEKCGRIFNNCMRLNSHKRSCYDVQRYLCDICGQGFNHSHSMKSHRSSMHFGEKSFQCKICQKGFSHNGNLRRHMRIHNNSYPYSCDICMRLFRHSNTLKSHMSTHKDSFDTSNIVRAEMDA